MAYTNQAKVEAYANLDLSSVSSQVTFWISAVKAYIDKFCGKTFEATSETRYYDGNGEACLMVDPFVGSPTVTILNQDGTDFRTLTEGADQDYITYPLNKTEKYELRLSLGNSIGSFPCYPRAIKITATFGEATTVPDDVSLVATMMVAEIARARSGGNAQSETLGDYSITYVDVTKSAELVGANAILETHRDVII